jgi:hypothetical protein
LLRQLPLLWRLRWCTNWATIKLHSFQILCNWWSFSTPKKSLISQIGEWHHIQMFQD